MRICYCLSPISNYQWNLILMIQSNTNFRFNGSSYNEAYKFIGKHYAKAIASYHRKLRTELCRNCHNLGRCKQCGKLARRKR